MALAMARPWKHPKTGMYWLRKRVPDDLRPVLGKLEIKESLKTKDPGQAKRLHAARLASIEAHWDSLRRKETSPQLGVRSISEREAHERASWVYDFWLGLHKENPSRQDLWKTRLYERLWCIHDPVPPSDWDKLQEATAVSAMERWCRHQADVSLIAHDLEVDAESRRRLEKAIGAAAQRASLLLEKWEQGDFRDGSDRIERPKASASTSPRGVTFEFLLSGWQAERKPLPKTAYEYQRVLRDLQVFLRHPDAAKVGAADIVKWKAHLIEARLHPKTIKDAKLAPVRAVLQWGVENHHLTENAAARVTMEVKRRAGEGKRGFTDEEAAKVLRAAAKEPDPARRWVPLLGAYSGARIAELSQLRAEDVVVVSEIPCMRITPEAGPLKTVSSERLVPLHPAVVAAGFVDFAKKVRSGPLFPTLKPDVFGSRGGNGTKIIGRWVRNLGLDDVRISPSHSWRHRFKTLSRRHGLALDVSNAITGHSTKTVAERYGEYPVDALYRELLKIPAVSIPDLESASSLQELLVVSHL